MNDIQKINVMVVLIILVGLSILLVYGIAMQFNSAWWFVAGVYLVPLLMSIRVLAIRIK